MAEKQRLQMTAVFFLLALITSGYVTTTISSRLIVEVVRMLSSVGLVLVLGILALKKIFPFGRAVAMLLISSFLVAYGYLLATLNDGSDNVSALPENLVVIILVGVVLLASKASAFGVEVMKLFLLYVCLVFLATVLMGGFVLDFPFRFVFQFSSSLNDADISYSQGTSKLYGLAAIAAAFLATTAQLRTTHKVYACLTVAMLLLAFVGGGRGDAIAAFVVVSFIVAQSTPSRLMFYAVIFGTMGIIFLDQVALQEFAAYQRFTALTNGDFGSRDVLLLQSFNLLLEQPHCLIFGCGFGYFQTYYQLPSEMYPHNSFVEAVIVWGLPISVVVFVGSVIGYAKLAKLKTERDALFYIIVFYALIYAKSGTVLGSWMIFGAAVAFCASAFSFRPTPAYHNMARRAQKECPQK